MLAKQHVDRKTVNNYLRRAWWTRCLLMCQWRQAHDNRIWTFVCVQESPKNSCKLQTRAKSIYTNQTWGCFDGDIDSIEKTMKNTMKKTSRDPWWLLHSFRQEFPCPSLSLKLLTLRSDSLQWTACLEANFFSTFFLINWRLTEISGDFFFSIIWVRVQV